jgi:hypothetical protein
VAKKGDGSIFPIFLLSLFSSVMGRKIEKEK